jgi:large subunit ribosomal protein L17
MRHAMRGRKLGRTSSHREALFRNQLQSLVEKERIITTLPKAKELRPIAERVITRGKTDSVAARRWALRWLIRRDLVKKLFDEISPRFEGRPGGYLRIVKLGPRAGDAAEMALIEMVELGADIRKPGENKRSDAAESAKGKAKRSTKKGATEGATAEAKDAETDEAPKKEAKPKKKKAVAKNPSEPKKETRKGGGSAKASTKKAGSKSKPTRQKSG